MYHLKVDKQGALPIYLQIRNHLVAEIIAGRLQPGEKIPSAFVLSKQMGVSKMTVLHALGDLKRTGYLFSSHGKGTYVSQTRKLEPDLRSIWGFTEAFQAQGYIVNSQLIHFDQRKADPGAAKALEIPAGSPIFHLTRKRLLNKQPVGIETTNLAVEDAPGLDLFDWNIESLYSVLKTHYGLEPVCGCNYIEATGADEATARLLSISRNAPVLATERISCLANHRPIEFVQSLYRADLMRFKVEMSSENPIKILAPKIGQI
jgi:GntR family transcriptional regulator